nr:MAG TPA: hypothetical protein [Caudoviricetes sp.]
MAFKRWRTPSGAHVTLDESWKTPGWTELPAENPFGVDGKPRPPIYPQPLKPLEPESRTEEVRK